VGTKPPSKDDASKEENAVSRKLCSSFQDDPKIFETSSQ
jgi:hypothetical protein